ncbi:MAG: DUF2007 domain-containing protein [Rhodospirillaceae bacterium]|nr:DUF2007 domain-containing protein [Rhodospirillaceae bacterium]MCY4311912.1 DUF2007 domain-containing protein [Rhodospirillaceae bacterium]
MRELTQSTNPVFVSWLEATLKGEGIPVIVLDQHMSVLEGSVGILPRRIMVAEEDLEAARAILRTADSEADGQD